MHSTKLTGMVIIFLINTFLFHFVFQFKGGASQAAVWIASIAFGLISAAVLHMTTKKQGEI
jgi:hypothetical protein